VTLITVHHLLARPSSIQIDWGCKVSVHAATVHFVANALQRQNIAMHHYQQE
jgi:hypothetical protein